MPNDREPRSERRRTTGENQRVTVEQLAKIRALEDPDLIMLISEIHDHGWDVASRTLSMMAPRQSDRPTS